VRKRVARAGRGRRGRNTNLEVEPREEEVRGLELQQGRAHLVPVGGHHGRHQHPAQASVLGQRLDLQIKVKVWSWLNRKANKVKGQNVRNVSKNRK